MNGSVRRGAILAVLLLFIVAGACAHADTTLTYTGNDGRYTVAMRPGDVRIDGGGARWQLYHDSDPALLSIDPKDQSYTRLDAQVAGAIRQQMNALRARIDARIQQLPADKRDAARAAVAAQIPGLGDQAQHVGLDDTGRDDEVAGVRCRIVQIVRDGEPADRLCVARAQALGLSASTNATVRAMFGLLRRMLAGTGLEGIGLPYRDLGGVPVRFVDGISGEPRVLMSVSHDPIADQRFQIPDTYIEKAPALPDQ